jgi:hypothetical protein
MKLRRVFLTKALFLSLSLPTATLLAEETQNLESKKVVADETEIKDEVQNSANEVVAESEKEAEFEDEFEDDWEDEEYSNLSISGFLKNETSFYLNDGNSYNDGKEKSGEYSHKSGDMMKFENSLNLFINYYMSDDTTIHAQTNFIYDTEAVDGYKGHRNNTQNDYLRELYIDTRNGGWDIRIGKQQLAWGTADGVKFLDIINPTDYREWGQNSMEDSRIPLWMLKAETVIGDSGTSRLQLVYVPDLQINQISGLSNPESGDQGQIFISKGADTMTGKYNGFYNIAKDMGKTSSIFQTLLQMGGMNGLTGPMKYRTVEFFTGLKAQPDGSSMTFGEVQNLVTQSYSKIGSGITDSDISQNLIDGGFNAETITSCFGLNSGSSGAVDLNLLNAVFIPMVSGMGTGDEVLNQASNSGSELFANFSNYMGTLQQAYMSGKDISFATGSAQIVDAGSGELNNATIGGALNSLGNMMYQSVAMGMGLDPTDPNSQMAVATGLGLDPTSETFQQDFGTAIQNVAMPEIAKTFTDGSTNQFDGTLSVENPTSAFDYMGNTAFGTFKYFQNMKTAYRKDRATESVDNSNLGLRFKSSIGGSTNYSLNYYYHYDNNPYVDLHWEDSNGRNLTPNFVAHENVPMYDPTSSKFVSTGQTVTALENMTYSDGTEFDPTNNPATLVFTEKMNRIHSIGASFDSTVDTPLIPVVVRGEFLYETGVKTPVVDRLKLSYGDLAGALYMEEADFIKAVIGLDITVLTNLFVSFQYMHVSNLDYIDEKRTYNGKDYRVYTANPATMSLSNGLKSAEENQQMYTFFLSKPFLEGDLLRVNNLLLLEGENGGIWDRFDMEYTVTDNFLLRMEYNYYGGDENGVFGQFEDQSSIQVGAKYLF